LRSAIDPSYRSNRLSISDLWRYQLQESLAEESVVSSNKQQQQQQLPVGGEAAGQTEQTETGNNSDINKNSVETAGDVRRLLIKEAEQGYHKDLRRGRYSYGSSKLAQHVVTAQLPPVRRSERLKKMRRHCR
jgi:hypothetical protein